MRIIRNNERILTDWYTKPFSSTCTINYYSNHPVHIKVNTVQEMVKKVLTLSDKKFHQKNTEIIRRILTENNYPLNIINRVIRKGMKYIKHKEIRRNAEQNEHMPAPVITLNGALPLHKSLPYINPVSEQLRRIIRKQNPHSKISFKAINKLREIYTRTKDSVQIQEKSNVIYEVTCNECDMKYIGQTSKKLNTRLKQHNTYIEKRTPKSALAAHAIDHKHRFNFQSPRVITTEEFRTKRETKEACYIYMNKEKTVNIRRDTESIEKNYKHILNMIQKRKENHNRRKRNWKNILIENLSNDQG